MIYRFKKSLQELRGQLYIDQGDYRQTVFLAGTGRSGTTWVQQIINHNNAYRIMFEPFHSMKIDLLEEWNYRQYLRADNLDDKFIKPASAILNGKIRHKWIDKYNSNFVAKRRLIKDIRAHFLLKWIKQNFLEIPIILLIRHPCAVANSKLKLKWDTHLNDFLTQEELMLDFLNPFKREIERAKDLFDKHIFMWCIENYVPINQFSKGEILLIFYENLCSNPQEEIESIFSFIGKKFSPQSLSYVHKPSTESRKESAIISGTDLVDSWRREISDKEIARAQEICSIFGMQAIYGEGSLPLMGGDAVLKAFSA